MSPVLEGVAALPIRAFDGGSGNGSEARVGNELVAACQHGDRVELHRSERAQQCRHPTPAVGRPDEALRLEEGAPDVPWCELDQPSDTCRRRKERVFDRLPQTRMLHHLPERFFEWS